MKPVLRHPHLIAIVRLLGEILTGRAPADRVLERHFRAHRNMGARDRGFVAEAVYGCLRLRRALEAWGGVEAGQDPQEQLHRLLTAYLIKDRGWSARAVADTGFARDIQVWADAMRTRDAADFPLAVRLNLSDELSDRFVAQYGERETVALAEALNRPATVDIRVNTHKATRAQLRDALQSEGVETVETPFSPVGLRRAQRGSLFNTRAFRDGWFELQDEGSQLLSFAVDPHRRQRVVDFCAGGGGKTLHLAALMDNTGEVIAMDINERRLHQLKPRVVRAGLDNIRSVPWVPEESDTLTARWGSADRVLVDAPCSGTGTLRRNPDIKWRALDVARLAETQLQILQQAAAMAKPGALLVYSTCSVLHAENGGVIEQFLARAPHFQLQNVAEILAKQSIVVPDAVQSNGTFACLPHKHGTDGFFCAVMKRQTP